MRHFVLLFKFHFLIVVNYLPPSFSLLLFIREVRLSCANASSGCLRTCSHVKHEIQKRCVQCSDDILQDVASKCDGYDAYDLVFCLLRISLWMPNQKFIQYVSHQDQHPPFQLCASNSLETLAMHSPTS